MNVVLENLVRRLRPLVGSKAWDYCVVWKLSENQRFIEWVGCCCGGSERININEDGVEEGLLHCHGQSQVLSCRDVMVDHPNSKSCELLSQLPSSIPLTDSGIHAQTLISNRPSWLFSHNSDSDHSIEVIKETVGTRVFVPVIGGLIELFVTKQVYEDQNMIDFIISQCNISTEQETLIMNSRNMDSNFQVTISNLQYSLDELESKPFLPNDQNDHDDPNDMNHHVHQQPVSSATENSILTGLAACENISIDRLHLCSPDPMDLLQQFNYSNSDHKMSDAAAAFFEVHDDQSSFASDKAMINIHPFKLDDNNKLQDNFDHHDTSTTKDHHHHHHHQHHQQGNEIKQENGRSDSISDCSDQNDDEDIDAKNRRGNGKGHQAKNLVAERKRRKKLNDRLYALRVLVPKISKLDKASILGDAIEYVQELQKQAKELQDELEAQNESDDDDDDDGASKRTGMVNGNHNMINESEIFNQHGIMNIGSKPDHHVKAPNGLIHVGASSCINNESHVLKESLQDSEMTSDKGQQMEPQVEVSQIDRNEFFVKVFCEQKHGGFTRLLEALDCLGLEVTNANVTSFRCLVSNVFQVKKRESEMVEADDVRESLLEVTRNQWRGWMPEMAKARDHHHHYHHSHHNNFLIQNHHLHHYHN